MATNLLKDNLPSKVTKSSNLYPSTNLKCYFQGLYTCMYGRQYNLQHNGVSIEPHPSFVLQVFGRHVATIHLVKGAYATEHGSSEDIDRAIQRCQVYSNGR